MIRGLLLALAIGLSVAAFWPWTGETLAAEQVLWIDWPVAYLPASFMQHSQESEAELPNVDRGASQRSVGGEPLRSAALERPIFWVSRGGIETSQP